MFLKDILFPKACFGCGFWGCYICPECQQKIIPAEKDTCVYCKKASYLGLTHPGCRRIYGLDGLLVLFYYNQIVKRIIKNIKYRLVQDAHSEFFFIVQQKTHAKLQQIKKLTDNNYYIQAVPLHKTKLNERGFNQADHIALFLSNMISCPTTNVLIRKKQTLSQALIAEPKKRFTNMRGAFCMQIKTAPRILIVDDVVTTGSTMKEMARTLKRGGAERVLGFALAKG